MASSLGDALEAERRGALLESFRLASECLAKMPEDAGALNLMGRLCFTGGDLASAVALQRMALRKDANHERAPQDLAAALAARPDPVRAFASLSEAVERRPSIAFHVRAPGSIGIFPGIEELESAIDAALVDDPSLSAAHAVRGNLHIRHERYAAAFESYRRAVMLDPDIAEAQLMLSEIAQMIGDERAAGEHRCRAFALRHLYLDDVPRKVQPLEVLMLCAPGPWNINMPLDFAVDHEGVRLHRLYLESGAIPAVLPPNDVVVCAMGESEANRGAIEIAARLIDGRGLAVLNRPQFLAGLARPTLARTLRDVPNVNVLPAIRRTREELASRAAITYPFVIRPIDTHSGKHFERIDDPPQFDDYLGRTRGNGFDVTAYLDYRSPDSYFRKYRVAVVDGIAYPYHLAISSEWMVHYITSGMEAHAWMREEEARFLAGPRAAFPRWDVDFPGIAKAVGLGYFAIDCTLDREGNLAIFEIDAAMLLHANEPDERFTYKCFAAREIFRALAKTLRKLSDNRPTMRT